MSEAIPRLRETAVDPGGQGVAPAEARPLTLILGGGITGLTAGWQLAEAGRAVIVVESSETAGGVAGSLLSRGQVYDFGSHRIHEQYEPEVFRLIKDLLGDDLLRQPRRGQILVQGRFLNYPPSIFQILAAFGLRNGFLFARDYALAALKRLLPGPQPGNFEEYAIASVGGSLYRKFYFPYARKLWNLAPTAISVDPAINRMKKFGVDQVFREVRKRLSLSAAEHYFYYPAQGFGQIGQKVGERFLRLGGRIRYASRATRLEFGEHGRIVAVEIQAKDGSTERLPVDSVVSTIPVDVLDGLLQRDRAGTAGGNLGLVWRSLRLLFVTTPDKVASQHETYYFPEPDYVFGRVSEIGKYSPYLKPVDGQTALAIEVPCTEGDELWSLDDRALLERCYVDLKRLGILSGEASAERSQYFSRRIRNLYPVQTVGWRERLGTAFDRVNRVPNLYAIGRPALFLHCNTDHCMAMALRLARHLSVPEAQRQRADWLANLKEFLEFRIRD